MKRPEQTLASLLKNKGLSLALAESMTCGLAAHKLDCIAQTSDIFIGSIVCYHKEIKTGLLGLEKKLIRKHTAESQKVTNALARNLKRLLRADVYAAVTGLAAAGGSETKAKPVGTIFLTVLIKRSLYKKRLLLKGSPLVIKEKACDALFRFIALRINSQKTIKSK